MTIVCALWRSHRHTWLRGHTQGQVEAGKGRCETKKTTAKVLGGAGGQGYGCWDARTLLHGAAVCGSEALRPLGLPRLGVSESV